MLYPRILSYVMETPWALMPSKLAEIISFLTVKAAGHDISEAEIAAIVAASNGRNTARPQVGAVAVLPITGTLYHRADMIRDQSGGASVERLSAQFGDLMRDPSVGAVLLDVNTPGGSTEGIEEFGDQIYSARGHKPVIAHANAMAASAGYWLASQASEFLAAPSSDIGAIGVWAAHADLSKALEDAGIKVSLISAGRLKTTGNPYEPLGEEGRSIIQGLVDDRYNAFVKAVARGRGVSQKAVREGFGEGAIVSAADSVRLGMVDGIATLDDAVQLAAKRAKSMAARAEGVASIVAEAEAPVAESVPDAIPEERQAVTAEEREHMRLRLQVAGASRR